MLTIKSYSVGELETNCYMVCDKQSGEAALVDPGAEEASLTQDIKAILGDTSLKYILLTHGHFDHIAGVKFYKELTGAKVVISEGDKEFPCNDSLNLSFRHFEVEGFSPDIVVRDNDILMLGTCEIRVIETPGHTMGSVCYVIGDNIFTGDTIMRGSIGRTDFPTSSFSDMKKSLLKLANIRGDYKLFCGHGDRSLLSFERENNPFIKQVKDEIIY